MTITAAWVRTVGSCEELVFVSDSRLSGGARTFDYCPKILTLPRADCAISFAGPTDDAYPLMLQLALAIDSHGPARRGSLDLSALKTHALKVFDSMADSISSDYEELESPHVLFLFGGYSWVKKRFMIWSIRYNETEGCFEAHPAKRALCAPAVPHAFIGYGSGAENTVSMGELAIGRDRAADLRQRILARLTARRAATADLATLKLDWEPFLAVRDMLRDEPHAETIGGAPQVVKIYQYMNAAPLAVFWPNREGIPHLQGRPVLGYERLDRWILDPDTLVSSSPAYSRHDVDDAPAEVAEEEEPSEDDAA